MLSGFAPVRYLILAALAAFAMSLAPAGAKSPEIYTGILSKTALGGYDAVAYFKEGKPVKGKSDITYEWKGVTWRFANEANRDAFKATPEAYAPQYGGYCAFAVAHGSTAKGDPTAWTIVNGKLYLNYDKGVKKEWERDVPGNVTKADKNWPTVLGK
jgi:YHS domain-containing protein